MQMPNRIYHATSEIYRFGYNGMEKSGDELRGIEGTGYTTEFRQYDPRLGRWLSLDPMMKKFPWMSPYVGMDNNPIRYNDPLGLFTKDKAQRKMDKALKDGATSAYITHNSESGRRDYVVHVTKETKDGHIFVRSWVKGDVDIDKLEIFGPHAYLDNEITYGEYKQRESDIATRDGEWASQRAKCASVDKLFETLLWEGTMLLTGEEIGNAAFNGIKWLYRANKARKAAKVTKEVVEEVVEEATEEATHVVYHAVEEGVTKYVGITKNLARRTAEHLSKKGINIEPLLQGLTKADARSVEQALIEIHKLGKNGGTLLNKINSISPSNKVYKESLERGYELLKSVGYGF